MKARSTTERNFKRGLSRRFRKAVRKSQMRRLYENPEIRKESALMEQTAAHFFLEGHMSMFDILALLLAQ